MCPYVFCGSRGFLSLYVPMVGNTGYWIPQSALFHPCVVWPRESWNNPVGCGLGLWNNPVSVWNKPAMKSWKGFSKCQIMTYQLQSLMVVCLSISFLLIHHLGGHGIDPPPCMLFALSLNSVQRVIKLDLKSLIHRWLQSVHTHITFHCSSEQCLPQCFPLQTVWKKWMI
jgi:hypothetical protein